MYRAQDEKLDRPVAIKVLLPANDDERARRQFARELSIVVRLGSHPHIVQVFDADATLDGRPYVAMELYQDSLADRLSGNGPLGAAEVLDVGIKICSAVQAAHDAGILHRDIKPQNILMSAYGPALADFGIARAADNLEWSQTLASLTPWHSAPEGFLNENVTRAADVYSIGSTLFTLLDGRPPFAESPNEPVMRYEARLARTPVPKIVRSDIPPGSLADLQSVLERALAKKPEDRYASAAELGAALGTVLRHLDDPGAVSPPPDVVTPPPPAPFVASGETIVRPGAVRPPVPEPAPPSSRRRGGLLIGTAVAAVVVIVAVVLIWLLAGGHGKTPVTVPPSPTPVPSVGGPTGFQANDLGATVDLSWTDNSNSTASYFIVYRSVDGPQQTVSVSAGKTSYEVTQLDPAKGYCFRLGAVLPVGSGHTTAFADASVRGCIAASPVTSPVTSTGASP